MHPALIQTGRRIALISAVLLLPRVVPASESFQIDDAQQPVSFNREVRPLLSDRCFHCHGPDKQDRKAGLRLDRSDGPHGAYRIKDGSQAVRPGSLDKSALWYRVTTEDRSEAMPPRKSHKKPLTTEEVDVIRRWITEGAKYEGHWAFEAPTQPAAAEEAAKTTAATENPSWACQPIDRLVWNEFAARSMRPSDQADKRTLIRRVTFDLTGLPPTRDEIRAFLADDYPDAYERLVGRLLAKPQYGEHMAKYWLDLVRFADTNGVHHDHYREMTLYRDWVIRSFNANLPYDDFVTDQLAGDLRPQPTDDQKIASGFHRLHMIIDRGTALPEESFTRNVIDRVTTFGTAFLGLTLGCAVCHDHKYDPIEQKDFYQFFAFFNNLDAAPETGGRGTGDFRRGLQTPFIEFPTEKQRAALEESENDIAEAAARTKTIKGDEKRATEEARKKELHERVVQSEKGLRELRGKKNEVLREVPAAMVMRERADIRPAHVLVRGQYDNPGAKVERNTPAFLPPIKVTGAAPSRMDLAKWLLSPEHPLTARVTVNRFWQQLFGVGIVKTSEDFGTQGEWPSHPELLDHLAVSFVESGWDVKALVRRIVTSETYRQSSDSSPEAFEKDPENRLLARGSRFRMDSEMIRDQILAASGLLSPKMFGKSVKPPQPQGIWKAVTLPSSFPRVYSPDKGDAIYRRSVYTFWKRGMPPPQMSLLNAPTRESCIARRERTNTPMQALLLLNESEYLKAARSLAAIALDHDAETPAERLAFLYETITSRLPDAKETAALLASLRDLESIYESDPELARQLCEGIPGAGERIGPELAAWTALASTVFNLDITKTRQ